METIILRASTGYLPMAVSPESITASVPSYTALATSVTSALVGLGLSLIHIYGDGFDIPYLLKCCRRLDLPYNFDCIKSVDIYKKIKPYRKLLGLENMKQKSIEQFLGLARERCV